MDENVRWSLTVSKDIDQSLRTFLVQRGVRNGDLSKFVEEAVHWRILDRVISETRAANANVAPEEIEAAVAEAVEAVRVNHPLG